jgi:hypothetical protein
MLSRKNERRYTNVVPSKPGAGSRTAKMRASSAASSSARRRMAVVYLSAGT